MTGKNKYNAKKFWIGEICFHSRAEAYSYSRLKKLEAAGKIANLELQPEFACVVNGKTICKYKADFAFTRDGKRQIWDIKGVRTPVFNLKKKLVEATHGVIVQVIPA